MAKTREKRPSDRKITEMLSGRVSMGGSMSKNSKVHSLSNCR